MLVALKLKSHGYIIYPSHRTYMGSLHVFNHYNMEAFTYHIPLELYVIYDMMDVMIYFIFMILYVICIDIFYIHGIICYMYGMLYVWYGMYVT